MTHQDTSGPAFPTAFTDSHSGETVCIHGMTLRDWFAGQALIAAWHGFDKGYYEGGNSEIAECAYQLADAMLEARRK